jgi:hypothetical protein
MGLWGGAARVDHKGIQAIMQDSLKLWFNAHIVIFDPSASNTAIETYDPFADNVVARDELIVFDSGPNGAIVLPSGAMNNVDTGGQLGTIGGMQFQTVREEKTPLPAGLRVRVLDGGNDTGLERFLFTLVDGVGSSVDWGDIIETQVVGNALRPA